MSQDQAPSAEARRERLKIKLYAYFCISIVCAVLFSVTISVMLHVKTLSPETTGQGVFVFLCIVALGLVALFSIFASLFVNTMVERE